jgi:hypothetical protein
MFCFVEPIAVSRKNFRSQKFQLSLILVFKMFLELKRNQVRQTDQEARSDRRGHSGHHWTRAGCRSCRDLSRYARQQGNFAGTLHFVL